MSSAVFEVEAARKSYGRVEVFDLASLVVHPNELVAIVGPSGCGKSTLLSCLTGQEPLTSGTIRFQDSVVEAPLPNLGVVFQRQSVFPWLRVAGNLSVKGTGLADRFSRPELEEYLAIFGLQEFARAWPRQLSGGMLRRLELARAVARRPDALLLDEPFSALDPVQKDAMHQVIRRVRGEFASSVVLVTHDVDEAVSLADRVIVLTARPGRIADTVKVDLPSHLRSINSTAPEFFAAKAKVLVALGWAHDAQ